MMSTNRLLGDRRLSVLALTVLLSGCTVQEQSTPGLAGPSELGLALTMAAQPETLPRDGASTAAIRVTAFDANGRPKPEQRMILTASAGTLNPTEVRTGADGIASAIYIAPGVNERVSMVTITAIPVGVSGGDSTNVNARTVRIVVLGPSIPFASFTFSPTSPAVLDPVAFDATGSSLDGAACGAGCSYSWDFGDGSSDSGLVVQHTFSSSGVRNVTLTATSLVHGTSNSVTRPVVVQPPALPVANFTTGACATPAASCVRFTDASTVGAGATITGYLIDFGDNTNAASLPAERTYAVSGTYNVRLTVTDSLGRSATTTRPIVIP